ncbi:hypothetical protein MRB53_040329 [Persea americana]|nr:hypothetical protein MRB53_040329 [Persea americana]
MEELLAFVAAAYPRVKYLITVCTGSRLAAEAGVLSGKRATTNKKCFDEINGLYAGIDWVREARWVVDGNAWTSSGVSAGMDVTFAWIEEVYGEKVANDIANATEYTRCVHAGQDPFAALWTKS